MKQNVCTHQGQPIERPEEASRRGLPKASSDSECELEREPGERGRVERPVVAARTRDLVGREERPAERCRVIDRAARVERMARLAAKRRARRGEAREPRSRGRLASCAADICVRMRAVPRGTTG